MCVSQRRWTGCRGPPPTPLPPVLLLLLPLFFLSSSPPLVQAAIDIPNDLSQPPILTAVPRSYTAFSQEDIYLPCEASGNPAPTFRWVKDGKAFGSETTASGTLRAEDEETLESYGGEYRCYASNSLGTAMTPRVRVIVEAQPVLLKQQKVSKRAREGESIILSCHPPQSSTPPHIHWMDKRMVHIQQSARVLVALDGTLFISNLLSSDSRDDYICNAQYAEARTVLPSRAVSLTVTPNNDVVHARKPHLFRPIGSHTSVLALSEQSVTLECIPKGLPTPQVVWRKKDGLLEDSGGRPSAHGRWLHFEHIEQNDDGEYECRAFNTHGATTHSYTLTVEASPFWVKRPRDLLYSPGETVRLDCQADGIPTPLLTWSINGQPLTEVDEDPRRSVAGGVLILEDVEFSDTAVYQCEAANKHGNILLNTYLYVIELPPQILSSDGVVYKTTEGGNVTMHCESFGSPRPHVTWEGEARPPLLSDPRVALLTNGSVTLTGAGHEDSGEYTCSIQHRNISVTAHLEVFNRTVMLSGPQDVRALRGSVALLDCRFYKDPQLVQAQVVWRRNEHKLHESSPDDKYTFLENGALQVSDIQSEDSASYSCEVLTELDHVKASGSITVLAPPDPPRDLSLSDGEDHSITLSWIPGHSHNSPITEFLVEVVELQHGEKRWARLRIVPGDFNHVELALDPFCTFRFRVIAANAIGTSAASQPTEERHTPPAVPAKSPSGVRSDPSHSNTLVVTWEEMDRRSHGGEGFHYKVSWRQAGGPDARWNHSNVPAPPFLVTDAGTYTPFEIKVQAVNFLGEGPAPEPTIAHSGEEEPEEAPTGVSTTVANSTVRVQWNEARKVRGLLKGYMIYVRRLGPRGGRVRRSLGKVHKEKEKEREKEKEGRSVTVVNGTKTSEEVGGLQLYSRYELSVTAFNSKGQSPHSPPHHFSTPEGVPGAPASLRFESPSEKSLVLYWTPPEESNGVLLGYTVQYQQEVASRDSPLQMETVSDPDVTHMELQPLDPSSSYVFKVIAHTAAGDGPPVQLRGATMLDGVPPSHVSIVSSNTSLNLSWVPGERDRNHGFVIQYRRKSPGCDWKDSEVLNSTQGFYSLRGLQPGSEYHLVVKHGNDTQWENVTWTIGPVPSEMSGVFAAQGWLIGLITAILLLVLILLILCLIKRSKGGKYAVKDKEDKEVDSEARPMKDEPFGEYSDVEEKLSQPSLNGSKRGSDDSLAEYGDSVDIQFNEDGSFIGQYSGLGPAPHGSGPASPPLHP
ncbi:neural cell adhesion molecule L1.1-like isoform X2 [Pseudoliparis swirei]|uniref:neural cell adhesion molecule L1.1-like isoform X2 n=1 Tax=Pseudoliparis swirei TaxID=2059687 RepID=UPI0024BE01FC|nr:neural cell adhesion molecule L1.1-like isoform X2 [Pseudoliparis swirei]